MATQKKATAVATATPVQATSLLAKMAAKYSVDPDKMLVTLKQTAFKVKGGEVSNEQMMALLIVADKYGLNPWLREIYAFPSENGIVAIVGIDGWIRIINERAELKSIAFEFAEPDSADYWVKCIIERHDRNRPTEIVEYLSECERDTKPWKSHPRRMLRHKALIQCARVAFGFGGIHDPDEAERIVSVVEQPTRAKIQQPRERTPAAEEKNLISVDQANALSDKLAEEGVSDSLFLASFNIGHIEELPADRYNQAIDAIDKLSAQAE